jgi:adenylate kinase
MGSRPGKQKVTTNEPANEVQISMTDEHKNDDNVLDKLQEELASNQDYLNTSAEDMEMMITGTKLNIESGRPNVFNSDENDDADINVENHEEEDEKPVDIAVSVHHACLGDNLEQVRKFIETENVDVNIPIARIECPPHSKGILKRATPLHCASLAGNIPIVEYLISYGAQLDKTAGYLITYNDITTQLENATPLHIAIKYKREEIVSTLLDAGADPALTVSYSHEGEQKRTQRHTKVNALHLTALFCPKLDRAILSASPELSESKTGEGLSYLELKETSSLKGLKLIILGPPAGGKGTCCEVIKDKYKVVHLSTGDILRDNISKETELGKKVKPFMENGQLVPDELIIDMVTQRLEQEDCKQFGWLLDGFPRTPEQSQFMISKGIIPNAVLVLKVADETVELRMGGRRLDPETGIIYHVKFNPPPNDEIAKRLITRPDDTSDKIKIRLENYYKHAKQVTDCFTGLIIDIDGNGDSKTVGELVVSSIDRLLL